MTYQITTNNHRRTLVDAWEVPAEVRDEYSYLPWDAYERGEDSATFVKYKGSWYYLGNVVRADPEGELSKRGWHGHFGESAWSGKAFRFGTDDSGEYVVVAELYWG